jgi:DNA polymerase III alpha subunit
MRKAIGKKKPELMPKLRKDFIDGCNKVGLVSEEKANELFDLFEASERYLFNKSHAALYSRTTYLTAYFKAHFQRVYFTSYLYYAKDKQKPREEIFNLVQNARVMDIDVVPPDFRLMNPDFTLDNKKIHFGLIDIKGVGESVIKQVVAEADKTEKEINKKVGEWDWLDFLLFFTPYNKSTAIKALICTGALDYFRVARSRMYYEYERFEELKDRETEFLQKKHVDNPSLSFTELLSCLINVPTGRKHGGCSSSRRLESVKGILESLKNPPFLLEDSIPWLAGVEEEMMGISLTCTIVEDCDISAANCDCRQFIKGYNKPGPILIACKIDRLKDITTKNKKRMAFLTVSDITGSIDSIVVFPDQWSQFGELCREGNTIMLCGKRGDKDKSSFVVDKIWQL